MSTNEINSLVRTSQKMPGSKVAELIKKYPKTAVGAGVLGLSASGLGLYHAFKRNYRDAQRDAMLAEFALAEKTSQYEYGQPARASRPVFGKMDGIVAGAGGGAALGAAGLMLHNNRSVLPDGARGSVLDSAKNFAARTKSAYTSEAATGGVRSGLKNVGTKGWQTLARTPGIRSAGMYGAAAGGGLALLGSLLG